jgi:hypothetical protein
MPWCRATAGDGPAASAGEAEGKDQAGWALPAVGQEGRDRQGELGLWLAAPVPGDRHGLVPGP